ncbi:hypothetical protein X753_31090 [Mesorhizobium sp. LNJC399B00]|nr:hypothetical protein X753_31090 [Mesorhizobium sp. LNJC399B00]
MARLGMTGFQAWISRNRSQCFAAKEEVADNFVAYAKQINAPIRCGVEVKLVQRNVGRSGFRVETSGGVIKANSIGPFQIPSFRPSSLGMQACCKSIPAHTATLNNCRKARCWWSARDPRAFRSRTNSSALGKRVYLSVGPHDRPSRAYRGRDFCWWLGVPGKWDLETPGPGTEHVTIAVSGARGGETIDSRRLAAQGLTLVGIGRRLRRQPACQRQGSESHGRRLSWLRGSPRRPADRLDARRASCRRGGRASPLCRHEAGA